MKKPIVIGALAIAGYVAAVVYLGHDAANPSKATTEAASAQAGKRAGAASTGIAPASRPAGVGPSAAGISTSNAVGPSDPRLAVLAVSQDNGLIQFVRLPDGKVISEIDKDPASPSYGRPLREYMYVGDKVIGLTAYRYLGDHIEIDKTMVSYKPDGSVDRFAQSTSIDAAKKK
jgi:hypothetical protein